MGPLTGVVHGESPHPCILHRVICVVNLQAKRVSKTVAKFSPPPEFCLPRLRELLEVYHELLLVLLLLIFVLLNQILRRVDAVAPAEELDFALLRGTRPNRGLEHLDRENRLRQARRVELRPVDQDVQREIPVLLAVVVTLVQVVTVLVLDVALVEFPPRVRLAGVRIDDGEAEVSKEPAVKFNLVFCGVRDGVGLEGLQSNRNLRFFCFLKNENISVSCGC